MFFRCEDPESILKRLRGKKRLILGNHDGSWTSKVDLRKFFLSVDTMLETSDGTPVGENGHALRLMKADPAGRSATTEYEVLEAHEDFSLLKIHLLTGRTHQIRAHLAALGHPLLGDELYQEFCGIRPAQAAPRTMLHSHEIQCLHPFTGEALCVNAPLPKDFRQLTSQ